MYDRKPLPRADVLIIDKDVRLGQECNEHDKAIAAILSAIRQLMGKSSTH
jgi:hypothetical protein